MSWEKLTAYLLLQHEFVVAILVAVSALDFLLENSHLGLLVDQLLVVRDLLLE